MEVVAKTEYQDIYRITYGVLLIVDKFVFDRQYGRYCRLYGRDTKTKSYAKGTDLKVLRVDTVHSEGYGDDSKAYTVPKNTILYYDSPVKLADKSEWNFKIKTTGESFSGDINKINKLIDEIKNIINN